MYCEIHPNLSNLFFYFCSLSKGDSYGDRHPAGPDLASFVYQRSCSVITATICVFVVYWYRVVLLSVPPFFAHHQHTIRLIPAKSASANITWEPRPRNFFTSEIWRKKLPCDKNSSFSIMKKRGFYQIEKQITICCKLTGFSICLCWQEPLSASV